MAKPIGTLGIIETVTVGGHVITDVTNLITAGGWINAGGNAYVTARKVNTTAGYQVTAGKTFHAYAVKVLSNDTGTAVGFGLAYGDNDLGASATVTVPTNFVSEFGGASGSDLSGLYKTILGSQMEISSQFTIPATKYMQMVKIGGGQVGGVVFGYEV